MARTTRIPRTIALLTTTVALSALVGCGSWRSDTKTVVVDHGAVTEKSGPAPQWVAATPDKYGKVCRHVPVQKAAWSTQLSASVPLKPGPNPAPKKPAGTPDYSAAEAPNQPKSPGLTKPTPPSKAPNTSTPGKPQGSTKEICGRGVIHKGTPGHWTESQRVLKLKDKKGNTTRWRVSETLWQQAELKKYLDLRKTGTWYHRI